MSPKQIILLLLLAAALLVALIVLLSVTGEPSTVPVNPARAEVML